MNAQTTHPIIDTTDPLFLGPEAGAYHDSGLRQNLWLRRASAGAHGKPLSSGRCPEGACPNPGSGEQWNSELALGFAGPDCHQGRLICRKAARRLLTRTAKSGRPKCRHG